MSSSIPVEFVEYDEYLAIETALASASAASAAAAKPAAGDEDPNTALVSPFLRKRKINSPIGSDNAKHSSLQADLRTELFESQGGGSSNGLAGAQIRVDNVDSQSSGSENIGYEGHNSSTRIDNAATNQDESPSAVQNEAKKHTGATRRIPSWTSAIGNHNQNSLVVDSKAIEKHLPIEISHNTPQKAFLTRPEWDESLMTERSDGFAWGLVPSVCPAVTKRKFPSLQFKGRIVYSLTMSDAEEAACELLRLVESKKAVAVDSVTLGFDTEWKAIFRRGAQRRKVAVLQLCVDADHCHVFHLIHSGVPTPLQSLLEDPSVFKVGVGAYGDAAKISMDYNVHVKGVKDLSSLANIKLGRSNGKVQLSKSWSLSSLAEELLGKQVDKSGGIRTSDWEVDKLSVPQLQYAATDAFASLYLFQVLMTFQDPKTETT